MRKEVDMMKNKEDWKFDKDKASKALQTLSCHVNPFRDENVAELVRVITYCMDLEKALDKAKELSDSNDELERTIHSLDCELSDVYNPKPYKFEDLKPNMWVWDNVAKECLYVIKFFAAPFTGAKYFSYLGIYKNLEEIKKLDIKFEENRFFPVQCANYLGGI